MSFICPAIKMVQSSFWYIHQVIPPKFLGWQSGALFTKLPRASLDMPWDAPEPQQFAEDVQQLSDSIPLSLKTKEPTIPVFHIKSSVKFLLSLKPQAYRGLKLSLNIILTWVLCANFDGKERNSVTDKNYENITELSNITIYGMKYLLWYIFCISSSSVHTY